MATTDLKIGREFHYSHPDLSQITDELYVSSLPKSENIEHILSLGIRLVISMPLPRAPKVFRQPPMQFVHCPSLDSRFTPIPMFILRRGVLAALPIIGAGNSVLVHCKSGVHRSVAMACCILIARGYSAEESMQLVTNKREKADPYVPYIRKRIEKFESNWRNNNG